MTKLLTRPALSLPAIDILPARLAMVTCDQLSTTTSNTALVHVMTRPGTLAAGSHFLLASTTNLGSTLMRLAAPNTDTLTYQSLQR